MPPFEKMDRRQKALLWPKTGDDGYGNPRLGAVTELLVRWTWKSSVVVSPQGNTIGTDATVVVDQAIPIGSLMWLGGLADLEPGAQPTSNIMEVVTAPTATDLKNRVTRRTVVLRRYGGSLPVVNG
jgi:hypothetical protein